MALRSLSSSHKTARNGLVSKIEIPESGVLLREKCAAVEKALRRVFAWVDHTGKGAQYVRELQVSTFYMSYIFLHSNCFGA